MESQHIGRLKVKIVEDIEKQTVRRFLWGTKFLGISTGTKAAVAPGLAPAAGAYMRLPGACCRCLQAPAWCRILGPETNKQLLPPPNWEDRVAPGWTWMLEVPGANKDKVGDA